MDERGTITRITESSTVSIAIVVVLVSGAFYLGGALISFRSEVQALTDSIGKDTCVKLKRQQLYSYSRSLARLNPGMKVPNPYNPNHVDFPTDRDCRFLMDSTELP